MNKLKKKKRNENVKKKKKNKLEEKKRQEEEQKRKEEEEEAERMEDEEKQERRRGISHRYKTFISNLSKRLKKTVLQPAKKSSQVQAEEKLEQIRQLASLQQMTCFMLLLSTCIWLLLVVTVGLHKELQFLSSNIVGLAFLIAFGLVLVLQFIASIVHRFETAFNAVSNVPMTVDCTVVEDGEKKYQKMFVLPQTTEEGGVAKVARKLLLVDKRTATKANLQRSLTVNKFLKKKQKKPFVYKMSI